MHPQIVRRDHTQATLEHWQGKAWGWGKADCAHMGASHLRRFGIRVRLARFGSYTTEPAALAAIRKGGFQTLESVVDSFKLVRITPAAAMVGDLLGYDPATDTDPALMAFGVSLGNGRVLAVKDGFYQVLAMVKDPPARAAWRMPV